MQTQTILLNSPVTVAGVAVCEIALREPRVRDQLAIEAQGLRGDMARDIALFVLLAGQPPELFHGMTLGDWNAVQRAYNLFFRPAPARGPAGGAGAGDAHALATERADGAVPA